MTNENNPIPLITPDNSAAHSGDVAGENVAALKALFPQIVTDGKVDFDVLRQLLGDAVEVGEERYGLNWKGKAKARAHALTPTLATLRPAKEDSVDWDTTQNLVIEGDNLEVLKTLRKAYAGKVKMIYIDPPYNTGTDMLYPNDYSDPLSFYLEVTGQKDGDGSLVSNPERNGRFHATWLNMMYSRITLAKDFLRDDGVLVCTIDENEQANLTSILKEVFGEGGYEFVCVTITHNPRGVQGTNFSYTHEYAIFVYRKGEKIISDRTIPEDEVDWSPLRNWGTESERSDARNCFYPVLVKDGEIVGFGDVSPDGYHPESQTELVDGIYHVYPIDRSGTERKWRYARQSVDAILHLLKVKEIRGGLDILLGKNFGKIKTVWTDKKYDANVNGTQVVGELVPDSPFTFPKSVWAVYDCIHAAAAGQKDAIIMDFFAGSGTTGHATMQLNADDGGSRRFILVQLPEPIDHDKYKHIAQVTQERLRQAGNQLKASYPELHIDTGFRIYKLDSSNLKPWQPDPDNLEASLLDAVSNILYGRSEQDLLVELLLKTGIDLTTPTEVRQIAGKDVHALGGGALIVCLADISDDDAEQLGHGLADWQAEIDPAGQTTFYFKDMGFASASAKANVAAILRQRLGDKIAKLASI